MYILKIQLLSRGRKPETAMYLSGVVLSIAYLSKTQRVCTARMGERFLTERKRRISMRIHVAHSLCVFDIFNKTFPLFEYSFRSFQNKYSKMEVTRRNHARVTSSKLNLKNYLAPHF
jgi:hypothetical protein